MAAVFTLDDAAFERMNAAIQSYGANADTVISKYLDEEGSKEIFQGITALLPASGRTWKGKKAAAQVAASSNPTKVFRSEVSVLTLTVKSRNPYNYLYFPDDGSNTIDHWGNQKFMLSGAEAASEKIIDGVIERLTSELEELL